MGGQGRRDFPMASPGKGILVCVRVAAEHSHPGAVVAPTPQGRCHPSHVGVGRLRRGCQR